jgi:hypothetical protein
MTIGKYKASKMIVAQSWALLKKDKEIMWFPVLSGIVSIIALVVLGAAYFLVFGGSTTEFEHIDHVSNNAVYYVALLGYYVVMMFIVNFFTAGLYAIVHGRFSGQDLTFRDGMNCAKENAGKIFWWSFISATVGVVLQFVADRFKLVGQIVATLLGAAWNILTYFSLPALVIGRTSVRESFKQSAATIRKVWGETIIVNLGVGLFMTLLTALALALMIGIIFLFPTMPVLLGMLVLFILFIIGISIISSALGAIFKLALYEYATTGRVPEGFSPELIQNAVQAKHS